MPNNEEHYNLFSHAPQHAQPTQPQQVGVQPDSAQAADPTIRPVTLGSGMGPYGTGETTDQDLEALSAYKTLEARKKRRRRRNIIIAAVVGVLALVGIGALVVNALSSSPSGGEERIDFDFVTVDTFESSVTASGAIKPASQVVVTPEIEGIITSVRVAEGDTVSKGDVLFTVRNEGLDNGVEEAEQAVKAAENGVNSAKNSVATAQTALVQAQENYDKVFATGYETQEEADAAGLEAAETLDAAQTAADDADLAVENAEIDLKKAKEALEQARNDAEKRTITAPESGAIVTMDAIEGASVGGEGGSSNGGSLVTIADLSTLRVSVQVNEVDINNLKEGQKAEVTFSALEDVVLEATVDRIASVSSVEGEESYAGGVVTYNVDMVINDPDPRVKPGMTARVKITTERIENALMVPVSALQMINDTAALVSVAPGFSGEGKPEFEDREVTVVAQDSMFAVVEGNLQEGDAVQMFYSVDIDPEGLGLEDTESI